jgi:glutamine kinase
MKFKFGTKAKTLDLLKNTSVRAMFCDQLIISVDEWKGDTTLHSHKVLEWSKNRLLAIRSSSTMEDTSLCSNAGAFHSEININPINANIITAVNKVISSYDVDAGQEVLIQPMVEDVVLSGVVFTRDLDTGSPYYSINYDDYSGRTDTVTSGIVNKLVVIHRSSVNSLHSSRMKAIVDAVQDIEKIVTNDALDIEFCVTKNEEVFILQVRPLAVSNQWIDIDDDLIGGVISSIRYDIENLNGKKEYLSGVTTILGEMPDWNPAEMIGNTPRPLAFSLYSYLITNRTWSLARADMGYRDVPLPLMLGLAGRPYIDVRKSLNSFFPSSIDESFAERLINYQMSLLAENRDLHDKVEFEIAITCRDLSFSGRRKELISAGFNENEIDKFGDQIGQLTAQAIKLGAPGLKVQLALTERVLNKNVGSSATLSDVTELMDNTIEYGTRPFSILARHAFIAIALLKSMVARKLLKECDVEMIIGSVHTVASKLVEDLTSVAHGALYKEKFLSIYGHLRPGTYDVLSQRYDENSDFYIGQLSGNDQLVSPPVTFKLTDKQRKEISIALADEGLNDDVDWVMDYITTAIYAREQAKFYFTKGVSDTLSAITKWGKRNSLSRDDISYIDIDSLINNESDKKYLKQQAIIGKEKHLITRAINLPHLIVEPDDIGVIFYSGNKPTFITNLSVIASSCNLDDGQKVNLDGKIILIRSADPGFDWIFSHPIKGLITQFGGANSHMSIRCAEFGLPAAIGCGERLFETLRESAVIELNCGAQMVVGH